MKELKIVIEISNKGEITADADGFSGDSCIKDLERLLDGLTSGFACVDKKKDPRNISINQTKTQKIEGRE